MTMSIIIYSALLVVDGGDPISTPQTDSQQQPDDDIETLQAIKEAQRTFEHHRRTYGNIFVHNSESESDEVNVDKSKKDSKNSDSDAPISTDTDSPYGSDSELSSSYDEYHAKRQIPKKKVHRHHKGPLKLYFEETIGNWPKYRYKKYKRHHMKKHGIQINYGKIHTKEIKRSLKDEKHERKKEESQPTTVINMMEDVAKQTSFLSLDPKHPIVPVEHDKLSQLSSKSMESEENNNKSESSFHKIKDKIKNSFRRKHKQSDGDDNEQMATNSDVASRIHDGEEIQKSNQSLDKV